MKWPKSRFRKLQDEVRSIHEAVGNEPQAEWCNPFSVWFGRYRTRTIIERIDALEKENDMLREFLGVERYTTERKTFYRVRKPNKARRVMEGA